MGAYSGYIGVRDSIIPGILVVVFGDLEGLCPLKTFLLFLDIFLAFLVL